MGFFGTTFDPENHTKAIFSIATSQLWYFALSVPFTVMVVLAVWYFTMLLERREPWRTGDLELRPVKSDDTTSTQRSEIERFGLRTT